MTEPLPPYLKERRKAERWISAEKRSGRIAWSGWWRQLVGLETAEGKQLVVAWPAPDHKWPQSPADHRNEAVLADAGIVPVLVQGFPEFRNVAMDWLRLCREAA